MSGLEIGGVSSVVEALFMTYKALEAIGSIKYGSDAFEKVGYRLVKVSQRLDKLQHASLNRTSIERLMWTPHNDSILTALIKDIERVRSLALRFQRDVFSSRRILENSSTVPRVQTLEHLAEKIGYYQDVLRRWDYESRPSEQPRSLLGVKRSGTASDKTPVGLVGDLRSRVLQWLSSVDHGIRHRELQLHQDSSIGDSFIDDGFMRWRHSDRYNVLWIHGKPGSGKTFLASRIIDRLSSDSLKTGSRLAYAYCDFRQHHTFTDIAASLIKQLLAAEANLPTLAQHIFRDHEVQESPSLSDLMRLYMEVAPPSAKVDIVIDAFNDLVPCTDHEIYSLLRVLERPSTKMVIFSRTRAPLWILNNDKNYVRVLETGVEPRSEEILQALKNRLESWRLTETNGELDTALNRLAKRGKGSFVTPICHLLEISYDCLTLADIRNKLEKIPMRLDDAPSSLIKRICKQPKQPLQELAIHTLVWLCQAKRPLSAHEICEAFVISRSSSVLRAEDAPKPDAVERCCKGLVVIDSFRTVALVHSSIRDHLIQVLKGESLINTASTCRDCLKYLTLADGTQALQRLGTWSTHPFLAYAESNWMHHLQDYRADHTKSSSLDAEITKLSVQVLRKFTFQNLDPLSLSTTARTRPGMTSSLHDTTGLSALHVCARFNLEKEARHLLTLDDFQNKKFMAAGYFGTTPFHESARAGSQNVAQLLLDNNFESQLPDSEGRTALHYAAYYDQSTFIQRLTTRIAWHFDHQDNEKKSALMLAAQLGHLEIVHALLDHRASVDLEDQKRNTALHFACMNGHLEVAQALLGAGASVTHLNFESFTPLHSAIMGQSAELIRLLLMLGAPVMWKSTDGRTALHLAADKADTLIVTRLVAQGADVDVPDVLGRTPLMLAARSGNEGALRALIDSGADVNRKISVPPIDVGVDGEHRGTLQSTSPLEIACQSGHTSIVKALLNRGADPNFCNDNGETAIFFAAELGHCEVVDTLLLYGADSDLLSHNAMSPLLLASQNGHKEVVQLLRDSGADIHDVATAKTETFPTQLSAQLPKLTSAQSVGGTGTIFQGIDTVPDIGVDRWATTSGEDSPRPVRSRMKSKRKRRRLTAS